MKEIKICATIAWVVLGVIVACGAHDASVLALLILPIWIFMGLFLIWVRLNI